MRKPKGTASEPIGLTADLHLTEPASLQWKDGRALIHYKGSVYETRGYRVFGTVVFGLWFPLEGSRLDVQQGKQ